MSDIAFLRDLGQDLTGYEACTFLGSGAVILTHDHRILLQRRTLDAPSAAGQLSLFGGGQDHDETLIATLRRELYEELGAQVHDATLLASVHYTRGETHKLLSLFFWHDENGSITGCYEGYPEYYDSVVEALQADKLEDKARWALEECRARGLLS